MKQRVKCALLAACLVWSMTLGTAWAAESRFADVPTEHWAHPYVEKAAEHELVAGIGGGLFAPDVTVSNGEWAAMLCNLFLPEPVANYTAADAVFGGETEDFWWNRYMMVALNNDLFRGTTLHDGLRANAYKISPALAQAEISRYDMAQTIANLAGAQPWHAPDVAGISSRIGDAAALPARYQKAVEFCFASGLVTGIDAAGTFAGQQTMTRGAAAAVLCRLLDMKTGDHAYPTAPTPQSTATTLTGTGRITVAAGTYSSTPLTNYDSYIVTVRGDVQTDAVYTNGRRPAAKLANGADITADNIAAMLEEVYLVFPDGTVWGDGGRSTNPNSHGGDLYWYDSKSLGIGGACNAYAYLCADYIFGVGADYTARTTDLSAVKPGDLVNIANHDDGFSHWLVVTQTGRDTAGDYFYSAEGNVNGKIALGLKYYISSAKEAYPNSTIYSYYN